MPIVFKNPDVAAKYETSYETDPEVHLPGGKNKNGWKGKLSEIPLAQADRWISRPKQNLLTLKEAKPAAKKEEKEPPKK